MTIERGRAILGEAKARLRMRRALGFFDVAHRELNREPATGTLWLHRRPFIWLLIAKWALAGWRKGDDRPDPTDDDVSFVANTVWQAISHLLSVDGRVEIFMRRLAFQQIWLQRAFDTSAIPRQFHILGELMAGAKATSLFKARYGLDTAEFSVVLAHMAASAGDLLNLSEVAEQRPLTPCNPDHWATVHAIFDRSVPQFHRELSEMEAKNTPPEVEVCEQSPFARIPFLTDVNHGPVCIHPILLFRMLETAVFDLARGTGARDFMNEFGPAFENHVAEVLEDLEARVIRERELGELLLGNGQVVDFAVVSEDALVLIDAKGIEGHYDELYHNLPAELAARLRTSLLRAVDQAIGTATRLPEELKRPNVYFLCVTFKNLAVKDGAALRGLTDGTAEWEHNRWDSQVLFPSQMLFPSAYEFESLVAMATARQVPLSHIIGEIVAENSDPKTARMFVEQFVAAQRVEFVAPASIQVAANHLRR